MIHSILDEGIVCHMGFSDQGQPLVIPTLYARLDDRVYIHGSAASRALRAMASGLPICVTVTLIDGLVLARTAFNHSINYRSVVMLGTATLVAEPEQKRTALELFTNKLVAGRWDDVRPPTGQELKATSVLVLPLAEVSAKARTGPPVDEGEDLEWSTWAGVIPLALTAFSPVPDPKLDTGLSAPTYAVDYRRPGSDAAGQGVPAEAPAES